MRWIFCCRLPLVLSVVAAACTPPSSTGGGSTGTEGDATSTASETGDATTTQTTQTTQTMQSDGGTATTDADTGSGGDTTMGTATDDVGSSDDSGSSGDSGSTGEPAVCPPTHACVGVAPMDWNGPFAFDEGDELGMLTECGGAFPTEVLATAVDAAAPDADCTCTCTDTLDCDDVVVEHCAFGTLGASAGGSCFTPPPNQLAINSSGDWSAGSQVTGNCSPNGVPTIDPVGFGGAIRMCEGAPLAEGCGSDEICLSQPVSPFSGNVCIYTEGDVACPAGDYTVRTVYQTTFEDTRECPPCSCQPTPALCDVAGNVTLYEDGGCPLGGSGVGVLPPNGMCDEMSFMGSPIASPGSFFVQPPTLPADACEITAGADAPIGSLTANDPVTVCCRP